MLRIPSSVPDDDERKHGDNYHSNKNDNNNNVLPSATFASQSAITHSHDAPTTGTTRRNRPHRMSQSSRQFASTSTTTIAAAAAVTPTPTTTFPYTAVAANVSAASLPRSYTKADGLYRLARSQDSQIMHTNVDHQSLMDALFSDSDEALERRSIRRARTTRPDSQVSSSSSTSDSFGRGSIELAISSNSNSSSDEGRQQRALVADDDIVAHAGSETLMDLFGAQKDLEQQMHAIEQQEKDAYAAVAAAAAATRTEREDLLDVDEMEKEEEEHGEKTTTHEQEFEMPSFIRVLYMGAASEKDKRNFMKKLSQAFATLFHYDSPSWLQNPKMFKERKHHLLLMDLVPPDQGGEDQYDNIIETCEDNGLSIIEADFTWSSLSSSSSSSSNEKTTAEDKNNLTFMIEQYVWLQCDSARQYPSDWQQQQQQQVPVYARQKFDGFVYPDKAPNGIDLCVYFYDNNYDEHNVKDRLRTDEDMVILWRLKKLGIPIMPILSSGNTATTTTTTTTRPRSQHHHHYQYPRSTVSSSSSASNPPPLPASSVINTGAAVNTIPTIDERRTQFADLLAQYKIRCVDISLSKLDVGLAPSFQKNAKKKGYRSSTSSTATTTTTTTTAMMMSSTNNDSSRCTNHSSAIPSGLVQRLGKDWAASSMTTPAPYQILTIDQFAALDRQTVFSILRQSRQKALKREKVLDVIRTKEQYNIDNKSNNNKNNNYNVATTTAAAATAATSDVYWMGTANSNKNTLYPNAMIQPRLFARLVFVLILIGIILLYCYGSSQQQRQAIVPTANKSLNLTAVIGMSTSQTDTQFLSFTVKLGDDVDNAEQQQQQQQREPAEEEENSSRYYYQCVMPLPPSTSLSRYQHHQVTPLAKLDIQFPYPVNFTHFDFKCPLMNLSGWQDSLEESEEEKLDSKSPLPASASNNNNKASSSSSSNRERNNNSSPPPLSPKVRGYWERLYHTTNYLFDHQSKILKLMFKGK